MRAPLPQRSDRGCPTAGATSAARSACWSIVDLAYETVRGIADGQRATAFAHGQQIIDAERATGTFFEPGLQAFFAARPIG